MTDIFEFLTYIITHHGYWAAITFIAISIIPLLAGVYITFSKSSLGKFIDKKFIERIEEEKAAHKQGNNLRKEFTKNVHEILENLATDTDADRALVMEFSNGTSNLVGLPFLFMSAAAEVVTPNTPPVGPNYQRLNLSIAANFLIDLEDHGYVYIEDLKAEQDKYPILAHLMLPNNVKSAFFYSLQGVDETIGFLVITTTTMNGKTIDKYEAMPYIARAAQKVSTLLNFTELTKRSQETTNKKSKRWIW